MGSATNSTDGYWALRVTERIWLGLPGILVHALLCSVVASLLLWQPGFYGQQGNGDLLPLVFALAAIPFVGAAIVLAIAAFLTTRRRRLWRLIALLIDTAATIGVVWAIASVSSALSSFSSVPALFPVLLALFGLIWLLSFVSVCIAAAAR